jgi:hypothetical protein
MAFLHTIYTVRAPAFLFGLVVFVINVAILESGMGLAQRIVFGVIAVLSMLIQMAFTIYIGYVTWNLTGKVQRGQEDLFSIQGIWPAIDCFLGLATGWGVAEMALWVADTTATHDKYWTGVIDSSNNWIVAYQFLIVVIDPMAAVSPGLFKAVHVLALTLTQLISLYHHYYLVLFISVLTSALYDRFKQARKRQNQASAQSGGTGDSEMTPLAGAAAPSGSGYLKVNYDDSGRAMSFSPVHQSQ